MEYNILEGYKHLGTQKGVCSGEVVVLGTRLKPEQIVAYGSKEEVLEGFNLNEEQFEECSHYIKYKNI